MELVTLLNSMLPVFCNVIYITADHSWVFPHLHCSLFIGSLHCIYCRIFYQWITIEWTSEQAIGVAKQRNAFMHVFTSCAPLWGLSVPTVLIWLTLLNELHVVSLFVILLLVCYVFLPNYNAELSPFSSQGMTFEYGIFQKTSLNILRRTELRYYTFTSRSDWTFWNNFFAARCQYCYPT